MALPQIALHSIPPFVVGAILIGLGAVVYTKNRTASLNRWFSILCWSLSIWYLGLGITMNVESVPQYFFWLRLAYLAPIFTAPIYFYLTVKLLGLERLRVVAWLYGAVAAVFYYIVVATNWYFTGDVYHYWWGLYPKASPLITVYAASTIFVCMAVCYRLFLRACYKARREGRHYDYTRLKYMCVALAVFGGVLIDYAPKYGIGVYPLGCVFALVFALIVFYAIVKHRLLDIDLVIRRSLVYSFLITILTVGYFGVVYSIERFFQITFGYHSLWVSLAAFALMALCFQPLKIGIQRAVDWLFFRAPHEEMVKRMERLEQEMCKSDQMKAVATFAAGLAHEIKNPLTAIKTFTEFLPQRYADPAFREKFTRIVGQEVCRIHRTVQDLLAFAKSEELQLEPVALGEVVQDTVTLLSADCLQRRIQTQVNVEPWLTIVGDRTKLKQVLLNLMLNSLDAMNGDGGQVRVTAYPENSHAVLAVSDTGCGIAPEDLKRLFEPFFTTKSSGTGLGLCVVQRIIKDHRGKIHIESQPGKGTTFTIELPLA